MSNAADTPRSDTDQKEREKADQDAQKTAQAQSVAKVTSV